MQMKSSQRGEGGGGGGAACPDAPAGGLKTRAEVCWMRNSVLLHRVGVSYRSSAVTGEGASPTRGEKRYLVPSSSNRDREQRGGL
jgi:hypothetical protein